jgi:peptidoglycan hydrolase-like protein with peptidoglycan-binding domain
MGSGKRASMHEGPLAALFRKTEIDGLEPPVEARALKAPPVSREHPRSDVGRARGGPDPDRPGRQARPRGPGLPGGREGLPGHAAAGAVRGVGALRHARIVAAGAAAAAAAAAAVILTDGGDDAGATRASIAPSATAAVERRDLVDRQSLEGTLGYTDVSPLRAGAAGTLTAIRESGSVVRRGHSLYDVENEPAAWLLYGSLPAWRDFTPYMSDGEDVRQLERNLRALGSDPDGDMTVDDEWTWATTAAVQRFQDARGLAEDGMLSQGEVVFRPGPSQVGELKASVGSEVAPGAELGALSATRREVTVDLDADRQELVRAGDTVTVELPDGDMARGRVTEVGKVATKPASEDAEPTIEVTIALRGRAGRGTGLDQAPVDVGFATERRKDVLAVPVTALLARSGGGFAVEAVDGDGRRRLVPVDPGMYAEEYVEVSGSGVREGMRVVTAE